MSPFLIALIVPVLANMLADTALDNDLEKFTETVTLYGITLRPERFTGDETFAQVFPKWTPEEALAFTRETLEDGAEGGHRFGARLNEEVDA